MNKTVELLCAHSIIACSVFIGLGGFLVAGWLPPVHADLDAQAIVALFNQDRDRIRFGMTVFGFSAMFYWFFAAAIASQMQRIEGEYHPLTRIEMTSSNGTALALMLLAFIGLTMCYRENIEPTTLQFANDLWWLLFVGLWMPGVAQNISIGVCILQDKRPEAEKIYPRWVAFVNFWVAVSFAPGAYIAFFHTGPFSWHGILGFWPVGIGFFLWAGVMWWATVRAIKHT